MTHEQAPQQGAAEPAPSTAGAAACDLRPAPLPKARKGQGFAAAFGDGSGAAFVFRDLASI